VKELVENALDAGATHVRVEIEDGGKSLIRIIDNGVGMSEADALLALRRHATSKVTTADDLCSIDSLGFRGEALPSIRSVSRFSLRTRTEDSDVGVRIVADGASPPDVEPVGCPKGTEITVRDLFFNTPARRKFLKRTATEMSRITELMDRFALGWPNVHFSLTHNGRRRGERPADRDLQARILAVLGRDVCSRLFPVRLEMGDHSVVGYTSEPAYNRSNARGMYTYINGRFVRDKVVQHAITQAYGTYLDRGRYPICVLYLVLPPSSVDVNVHPAKAEVRFVESGAVHGLIERSLRLTLADAPWGFGEESTSNAQASPLGGLDTELDALPLLFADRLTTHSAEDNTQQHVNSAAGSILDKHSRVLNVSAPRTPEDIASNQTRASGEAPPDDPSAPQFFSRLHYLGQVGGTYSVCESANTLHLIDLHVAHQQILFHSLRTALADGGIQTQRMLFPMPVTLSSSLGRAAEEFESVIRTLGMGIEPFGGAEWVITEVPHALAERDPVATATELLTELTEFTGVREAEQSLDKILSSMSRRAAWKRGQEVPRDDALILLKQLDTLSLQSGHQPGGKFVVSHPFERVARWFDGS
jgi:DNA mismatch repair protein MutL